MKMFAFKIEDREGELQCEECTVNNTQQPLYGVVAIADIAASDTNLTKKATAERLLWEKGGGQVLCINCINKKRERK